MLKSKKKLHWAIHFQTVAEVIYKKVDSKKTYGLTTWKDAPKSKIHEFDVVVAKNYLTEDELKAMGRMVNAYLDLAELRAEEKMPMRMNDWVLQFDDMLRLIRKEVLTHTGKFSSKVATTHAKSEFQKYRIIQDELYVNDFDKFIELEKTLDLDIKE